MFGARFELRRERCDAIAFVYLVFPFWLYWAAWHFWTFGGCGSELPKTVYTSITTLEWGAPFSSDVCAGDITFLEVEVGVRHPMSGNVWRKGASLFFGGWDISQKSCYSKEISDASYSYSDFILIFDSMQFPSMSQRFSARPTCLMSRWSIRVASIWTYIVSTNCAVVLVIGLTPGAFGNGIRNPPTK